MKWVKRALWQSRSPRVDEFKKKKWVKRVLPQSQCRLVLSAYSLRKTSENILKDKVFTGVFPAQQTSQWISCLPCINREFKCKENDRQTLRLLSWENIWKQFRKTKCLQEFFQPSKIAGECHVFLVFTVNINVKKTWGKHRVYPLGKTVWKHFGKQSVHRSFSSAAKLTVNAMFTLR